MTRFIRLIEDADKVTGMMLATKALRENRPDERIFAVEPNEFAAVPGAPFAYWVSDKIRRTFFQVPSFENDVRTARQGLATASDFRFIRTWWECTEANESKKWFGFAKGGSFSRYYADIHLMANWENEGAEDKAYIVKQYPYLNGNAEFVAKNPNYYFRRGLTWPRRSQIGLGLRVMPKGCIFADKGPAVFTADDEVSILLSLLAITNSSLFRYLVELQMAFGSYEVGVIQRTPVPDVTDESEKTLAQLARRAWSLKRALDAVNETSHAFSLPMAIRDRIGEYQPVAIEAELATIQQQIEDIVFELYGLDEEDRRDLERWANKGNTDSAEAEDENEADVDSDDSEAVFDHQTSLLSWCVGVALGRFDWRLATGERAAPAEPEPFDPLPAKSPGMLPDGAAPFHANAGILVDDAGHPHDLPHWLEEVLMRVGMPVPHDLRNWLQREFFAAHLQRYSKSRRKAPIYWPLSTASGSYSLWLYYPSLTNQTLYTCVNDFLEPKLKQVGGELANLRGKGSKRSLSDEKQFEKLQTFELELTELRDTLLKIAPHYHPNQDDGVQITAAPLWPLFRHKPWQKVLKETWAKLEKGDYDWAHLAMQYWPERVRAKCKADKSLAIAHGLEELYVEPVATTKKKTKK